MGDWQFGRSPNDARHWPGLWAFDVEEISTHGGSLFRACAQFKRAGMYPASVRVALLLATEQGRA
jgi:hypothetical protein